jgi:hypothetical protein
MRVDLPAPAPAVVISRADFESDFKRGYCVLEFRSAGEEVLRDMRNPGVEIRRKTEQVLMFRCMRCQFDCVDGNYAPKVSALEPGVVRSRTGKDLIQDHLAAGVHPWSYSPFQNPYGNIADVVIEGIEEYEKELKCR